MNASKRWDVFVCHASEDKYEIAKPLAQALVAYQLQVWFDEFEIKVGDSITEKIECGLAYSDFGILILSKDFILKPWPRRERNALLQREINEDRNIFLPVRHKISQEVINRWFPLLQTFTL